MKIKKIVQDNSYQEEFLDLLNYCFGIPEEDLKYDLENLILKEKTEILGSLDGRRLQGGLIINDFKVFWQGLNIGMGGIGGVTSYPEYRDGGIVANLLKQSLKEMYDNNQIISLLGPFDYSFYRKYGWEIGEERKKITVDINELKQFKTREYTYKPLTKEHISEINEVYCQHFKNYNGATCRNDLKWNFIMDKNKKQNVKSYGVYEQGVGVLAGYLFYVIEDGKIELREFVYRDLDSLKALLGFIFVHRAQVSKVNFYVPLDCPITLLLDNPRQETKLDPGMMVRAVDVKKILEQYPYKCKEGFTVDFNISDPIASWNDGVFRLNIEKNEIKVTKVEEKDKMMPQISCSIQVFSQLFFGYLEFHQAAKLDMIKYSSNDILNTINKLVRPKVTFITDFF